MGADGLQSYEEQCESYIDGYSGDDLEEGSDSVDGVGVFDWCESGDSGVAVSIIYGFALCVVDFL